MKKIFTIVILALSISALIQALTNGYDALPNDQVKEVKVTLKGKVIMNFEKAVKGIDFEEKNGEVINLSNDLLNFVIGKGYYEILRTRVNVTNAIGEDGKVIAEMKGKSLIVVGNKKSEVQEFSNKDVEILGIIKNGKEIDVTSVKGITAQNIGTLSKKPTDLSSESKIINDLVSDYLALTLCLLNRDQLRSVNLNNSALSLLDKHNLSKAKVFNEFSIKLFEVVLTSNNGYALIFDSEWADPLLVFIDGHGDFPTMSFRQGSATIMFKEVGYYIVIKEATEVQIDKMEYIFKQGKWSMKK